MIPGARPDVQEIMENGESGVCCWGNNNVIDTRDEDDVLFEGNNDFSF